MAKKIRIFGAGVRGQVIADFLHWHFRAEFELDGFYDDSRPAGSAGPAGALIRGTVQQGVDELRGGDTAAFMALGTYRSWRNCEILAELAPTGVPFPSLIAPTAHVSPSAQIGSGASVMGGVFVGAHARVGRLFGANAGSVVEHHAVLGDNVLLGSSVALAGSARVGDHCFIGTNSCVLPEVSVGVGTLVGSGSVVARDLPAGVVAYGAPARMRRAVTDSDEVPSPEKAQRLVARLAAMEAYARAPQEKPA